MELVVDCFSQAISLNPTEKYTFISGYVTRKEKMQIKDEIIDLPESEFTSFVSRGKLVHARMRSSVLHIFVFQTEKRRVLHKCFSELFRRDLSFY